MSPELGREKVSVKHGYWFYFEDEGTQIVVFASALSGKEVVFVDDEIVSSKHSFRLKATHSFEYKGRQYEVIIAMENLLKGTINCSLQKDGVLLNKTSKSFHQRSIMKVFLVSLCLGVIFGFSFVWLMHR
jgi:hypothetical protein